MKVRTLQVIDFWRKPKDVDKKKRERIQKGEIINISKEHFERLEPYVEIVEETPKGDVTEPTNNKENEEETNEEE